VGLASALIWWSGSGSDVTERVPTTGSVSSGASSTVDTRQTAVVFPFENLGPPEEAYFAAGVSEEITSRLAAVSGLRVISRTSAVQYERSGKTMKEIGKDLGVDFVLEGSVRWARTADGRGRVRITPQLIRVADDSHLWSETYDREVNDIFEVQTDIATRVIDRLGVTLLGSERAVMEGKPTQNLEAYQAYLQATNLTAPPTEYDTRVVELLERATRLDPTFVAAWYRLARHHSGTYRDWDRTEARLARARQAVQGAEAVDSQHPMTHLARGYYYYYGFRDYDRALEEFEAASKAVPNDSDAIASIAYIYRRQGRLNEMIDYLKRAHELDPQNAEIPENLAATYMGLRRFEEAIAACDQAIALAPNRYDSRLAKAGAYLLWKGDLKTAREVLAKEPTGDPTLYHIGWYWLRLMDRDYARAIDAIGRIPDDEPFFRPLKAAMAALAEALWRGPRATRGTLESAARILEDALTESPSDAGNRVMLSLIYAYLGREKEAVSEAKLAVDLTAKDLFSGPQELQNLAAVYAILGRHDEAIDLLERLLSTPYENPITVPELRLDPMWDPLRDHPRFKELVKDPGRV
jgi:serine/threonine-protein kinase